MSKSLRIVIAQLNLTVGDIEGNIQKHIHAAETARHAFSADIIVFPELSITGYPPEDLLLRPAFLARAANGLQQLLASIQDIHCVIGHPLEKDAKLFNACSLIYNGKIIGQYAKQHLPNYGIFDEKRYFHTGNQPCITNINNVAVGLVICEDLWVSEPVRQAKAAGAEIILAPNASPFETDKHEQRLNILTARIQENHLPIVYVNCVGGQDELIFDGDSMVLDAEGNVCQNAGFCIENLLPVEVTFDKTVHIPHAEIQTPEGLEKIYQALVLALHDYVHKNHFSSVILGLSGGIDSALTLTLAVDALGHEHVRVLTMPSRFTQDISNIDAEELARNLGVQLETFSIESVYTSFLNTLAKPFASSTPDITEENIQARCRAILLMAFSNKFGPLVLTTGNRSELAVGYCTLYGDMAGGFAPLKDVPKTLVYALSRYRNTLQPVIPIRTIERAPTAELAEGQKDEDSLPPYSILDQILEYFLNKNLDADEIIAKGFDAPTVHRIIELVRKNEYKRRQAAVGPRINQNSFGRGWRYPITDGFKG